MRTSTISAAATGRVAACASVMPFSSICHIRDSTRIESFGSEVAGAQPLGFAEGDIVGSRRHDLDAGDEIDEFGEIRQHHDRIGAGVVLLAKFLEGAGNIAAHQRIRRDR